jgi:hypothetical protein
MYVYCLVYVCVYVYVRVYVHAYVLWLRCVNLIKCLVNRI